MQIPAGFQVRAPLGGFGVNVTAPNYNDVEAQFDGGYGELQADGRQLIQLRSVGHGGIVRLCFAREAWQRFLQISLANERIMREMFRPVGVLLTPIDGSDPIRIEEGTGFRLVGDRVSILGESGMEIRSVPAADFNIGWIRQTTPPTTTADEE